MFRMLMIGILAGAALLSAAEKTLPDSQKLDVFLLVGQSNMAGRGKIEAEDLQPDPRVWVLNQQKVWAPAVDPLHFDKPKIAGVGLGLTFGKILAARDPKRFIGLVPCAFGGTTIEQWKKGGALYEEALVRARLALKHGELAGILWHQGESDAGANLDTYPQKFEQLMKDFRTDLQAPNVPIVAGHLLVFMHGKSVAHIKFNNQLSELPKKITGLAIVSAKDLTANSDNIHFDANSLREFGKRYAEAYLGFEKAKK